MKWKVVFVRWMPPENASARETLLLDSFEETLLLDSLEDAAYLIKKTYEMDADLHHVYVMRVLDDHKVLDGEWRQ